MYRLKKIDLATVAIYSFIMLFILSLLFVIPFGIIIAIINTVVPENAFPTHYGPNPFFLFGGIFIFILPVFYAVFGTIVNVLIALCYNLLSIKLGGIKLSLKKIGELEESSTAEENRGMQTV